MGNVPSVPSLALGSGEVTLMAMTSAYAAFADQGLLRPATFIRRVEDAEGKVLFEAKPEAEQVISPRTAFLMTSMLCRRRQFRHGVQGAARRVHVPGGGQDRHDQRLCRCVVRRLHAASRHRRLGRLRQAADDHRQRVRRRAGGADVGAVHETGNRHGQARHIQGASRPDCGWRLPAYRVSCRTVRAIASSRSTSLAVPPRQKSVRNMASSPSRGSWLPRFQAAPSPAAMRELPATHTSLRHERRRAFRFGVASAAGRRDGRQKRKSSRKRSAASGGASSGASDKKDDEEQDDRRSRVQESTSPRLQSPELRQSLS